MSDNRIIFNSFEQDASGGEIQRALGRLSDIETLLKSTRALATIRISEEPVIATAPVVTKLEVLAEVQTEAQASVDMTDLTTNAAVEEIRKQVGEHYDVAA